MITNDHSWEITNLNSSRESWRETMDALGTDAKTLKKAKLQPERVHLSTKTIDWMHRTTCFLESKTSNHSQIPNILSAYLRLSPKRAWLLPKGMPMYNAAKQRFQPRTGFRSSELVDSDHHLRQQTNKFDCA